jgi:type I restriction enzyme S subunit
MAASSAGQYNLGLKKLNGITLPCPSLDEQDRLLARFDEKAWAYESLRRGLEVGRTRTESLRRSVLAAAFSGRLTGRASDIEIVEEMAGV